MKYFQDITLLRNARIDLYDFWEKLYQQIHIALAENKAGDGMSDIGVAFPEYDADAFSLGTKLRLVASTEEALVQFQCEKWLSRLRDYVVISSINSVPDVVDGYVCFSRWKEKGSFERLARRRAKKLGITFEEALAFFENQTGRTTSKKHRSKLPYIHMNSLTNSSRFRLFIEKQPASEVCNGSFSCYGLSSTSTVPMF